MRKISRGLMLAIDSLAMVLPAGPVGEQMRRKVLVVRLDALGDLVLFTDALRAIRERYPPESWELTLVVNAMWTGLLTGQGFADQVRAIDRSRFLSSVTYRYSTIREVRKNRFDLALNLTSSREAMLGDALIRGSSAPDRIGWEAAEDNISTDGRIISDRWYTKLFPAQGPKLMELERNAMFVRQLGSDGFKASMPRLEVKPGWIRGARSILEMKGAGAKFAVLIPGTGPPSERSWPPENWARLSERIVETTGLEVVLCGGRADRQSAEEVVRLSGSHILNLTGETTVELLAGVIALGRIVVGSDTGPVHLSGALGVPSVCILGGAFPGRFFPYSVTGPGPVPVVVSSGDCTCKRWDCRRRLETGGIFPCIDAINTEAVLDEVVRVVGNDLKEIE